MNRITSFPSRSVHHSRAVAAAAAAPVRVPGWLLAWLALGLAGVLLVPAARGGALLGATLPYWLVAAPLIVLATLERAWLGRRLVAVGRRLRLARTGRQARRLV